MKPPLAFGSESFGGLTVRDKGLEKNQVVNTVNSVVSRFSLKRLPSKQRVAGSNPVWDAILQLVALLRS